MTTEEQNEFLDTPIWKIFNTAIAMYIDNSEKPFFELYVNGKAFKLSIEVEELDGFEFPKEMLN